MRTLHPQIVGRRFAWGPDKGTTVDEASFEVARSRAFRNSPMSRDNSSGATLRRRLVDPDCPIDYPILSDLRAEGVTDYVVSPLRFTNGDLHFALVGDAAGGRLHRRAGYRARVGRQSAGAGHEIRALHRVAGILLSTYIGQNAGERVLAGQIRRGHTDRIHAAIWLSDMRGFTKLADRLPPQELVDLLNRYFDCQVPAILDRGGEVLKFMGDGLLAIFPITEGADPAKICAASRWPRRMTTRENVAALDAASGEKTGVRFGLALHMGDVLYGNIGSGNRLDFTKMRIRTGDQFGGAGSRSSPAS